MSPTAGAYPISGVAKLPNAAIASPGEVWSNVRADGVIIPGAAVFTKNLGGKPGLKQVANGDAPRIERVGVALRQVEVPDVNSGPGALGPNELVNRAIASGDYLRRYMTGVLHLTLVVPRNDYVPGQIIGWDPDGVRPAGKAAGTGAWTNVTGDIEAGTDIFEVHEPYRVYGAGNEGLLTVRFLRSNQ